MLIFNILLKIILFAPLASVEGEEWVVLDPPLRQERSFCEEESSSIWVLVSKQVGDEHIRVRFPGDPEIFYSEVGALKMELIQEDHIFSLEVLPLSAVEEGEVPFDCEYRQEGRWVRQKWIQSTQHWYVLESRIQADDDALHVLFTQSFELISCQ